MRIVIFRVVVCLLAHAVVAGADTKPKRPLAPCHHAVSQDLEVVKSTWGGAYRGSGMAHWAVTVRNRAACCYQDFHFETSYFGESGTQIDRSWLGHTEYVKLQPGQTRVVTFDEFVHSQAVKASIRIDTGVLCDGFPSPPVASIPPPDPPPLAIWMAAHPWSEPVLLILGAVVLVAGLMRLDQRRRRRE